MFTQAIPGGRKRTLDRNKKQLLCETIARGATMGEAAATMGVSLRTVQREARRDAAFDAELRRAHHAPPDLHQLMQSHARSHWRASAWLLERQDPERYGRRPASSCSPVQFHKGLRAMLEAALEAVPAELRSEVYQHVHAASEQAFREAFPTHDRLGGPHRRTPAHTPLADAEHVAYLRAGHGPYIPDEVVPISHRFNSSGSLPLERIMHLLSFQCSAKDLSRRLQCMASTSFEPNSFV